MKCCTPVSVFLLLFLLIGPLGTESAVAQRKSELLKTIDSLESRALRAESALSEAQRKEKASTAKAEEYEAQVTELKDANATLLANLGNFAQVSNKSTASLTKALSALEERENQLKGIIESLNRNDSLVFTLVSDAKQTLGPDTKISVSGGGMVISRSLTDFFGSDTGTTVQGGMQSWLEGVAGLAQKYPEMQLTVEGLSMTGEFDIAANQATSVMNMLSGSFGLDPSRISARGRDGNFSEGIDIFFHPNFRSLYVQVKSEFKQ